MIIYIYMGYPLCVWLLAAAYPKGIERGKMDGCFDEDCPMVSILIAAYNEADHIAVTLENKLQLNYPRERFEVLVISDGSTDGTDEIVTAFATRGVRLLRQSIRGGKTAALNVGATVARGEILVFSDANSLYEPQAMTYLVENFSDPTVGYVTGKMIYVNADNSPVGDGCSAYMKYENFLREKESVVGSVVGVDGGIDAVRKVLFKPMQPDQLPDFVLPLKVVQQGFRVVFEPRAVLREKTLHAATDEYRMRVRVSLRALWALFDMVLLLVNLKDLRFAWQLWSHKVFRYLCFMFLAMAWLSCAWLGLSRGGGYGLFFILQNLGYLGAWMAHVLSRKGKDPGLLYLFYYFVLLNLAAGHAFIKFIMGKKQVLWTPRKG
ncbi:MAG: glycosyltransferase family 2 protein [Desulfobacterium sp.]